MIKIGLKQNFPAVQKQLDQLVADVRSQALVRAINRTVEPAKPEMAREIAKEFNVTVATAKESLRVTRARFTRGKLQVEATLESPGRRGRSLNLINFMEKTVNLAAAVKRRKAGEGGSYALRNGVTVAKQLELRFKIKRGSPWKVIPGAFVGNAGRTVFIREGKKRLPIKALQTIDIAQMFNAKRINARVVQGMLDRFPAIFEHEAKYYTDRFNARKAAKA